MTKHYLFTLLAISFFSYTLSAQSYSKRWQKVYEDELSGLTKSADEKVMRIYKKAIREQNDNEWIKTYLYRLKFMIQLNADAQNNVITTLRTDIRNAKPVQKAILQYIYAKTLVDYYNENKKAVSDRKPVTGGTTIISEWTVNDFVKELNHIYTAIFKSNDIALLTSTPLSHYHSLVSGLEETPDNEQNLYTFLGYHWFTDIGTDYWFNSSLNDKQTALLLDTTTNFIQTDISVYNELFKKVEILQLIEKANEKKPADQKAKLVFTRYQLLNKKYNLHEKTAIRALTDFCETYKTLPIKNNALYELIQWYNENNDEDRHAENLSKHKALQLIQNFDTLQVYNKQFITELYKLKKNIEAPVLGFNSLEQLYENQNHRVLVGYKNIPRLVYQYYKLPDRLKIEKDTAFYSFIARNRPISTDTITLRNTTPYLLTTTEIMQPSLQNGRYLLVIKDERLKMYAPETRKQFSFSEILVTNMTAGIFENENGLQLYLRDSKTGKPVEGANIQLTDKIYKSDNFGNVDIPVPNPVKNTEDIIIASAADTLRLTYHFSKSEPYFQNQPTNINVRLLLDRGVYRPGQTIYFKGISTLFEKNEETVLPDKKFKLILYNESNGGTIEEQLVKTNNWGAFSGTFVLPKNLLTGYFSLIVKNTDEPEPENHYLTTYANVSFSVKEYKRPTFEVHLDKIKDYIPLGKEVTVTGTVKSLTGGTISNAHIKYQITKQRNSKNNKGETNFEVKEEYGNAIADKEGCFMITLPNTLLQDEDISELPYYTYDIFCEVTDASGETQVAQTNFNSSSYQLFIQLNTPADTETSKPLPIHLNTSNTNGTFLQTEGTLKVYATPDKKQFFLDRIWETPDEQLISEELFEKLFPLEPYDTKEYFDEGKSGTLLFEKKIITSEDGVYVISDISEWESGQYRLSFEANDPITKELFTDKSWSFRVKNIKDPFTYTKAVVLSAENNQTFEKDRFIKAKIVTPLNDVHIMVQAFSKNGILFTKQINLQKGVNQLNIPLLNDKSDVFYLRWWMVFEGNLKMETIKVTAVKHHPILKTEVIHSSNKLDPGKEENWQLIIKNEANEPEQAEILATMYDASLDQFNKSFWNLNSFKPDNSFSPGYITTTANDGRISKKMAYDNYPGLFFKPLKINYFNWFGYSFVNEWHVKKDYFLFLDKLAAEKKARGKKTERKTFRIKGRVIAKDYGDVIPGASISIFIQGYAAETDMEGNFELDVALDDILLIDFIGFKREIVKIASKKELNIELVESEEGHFLESVVIDTYRTKGHPMVAQSKIEEELAKLNIYGSRQQMNDAKATVVTLRGTESPIASSTEPLIIVDGMPVSLNVFRQLLPEDITEIEALKGVNAYAVYGNRGANGVLVVATKKADSGMQQIKTRKNLQETAFFYPHLTTDTGGNVRLDFTSPEALTRWRFRTLAHTKKGVLGYSEQTFFTQKDILIQPNMPRFVRETDTLVIKARITNLTDEEKSGNALLEWFNAVTRQPVETSEQNKQQKASFKLAPKASTTVSWILIVPENTQALHYKIAAKAGNFTDAEENDFPVLSSKTKIVESYSLWVPPNQKKEAVFPNLSNHSQKENQSFVLSYTGNPLWMVLQALPSLKENKEENPEQLFERFYVNTLGAFIVENNTEIKNLFTKWLHYPASELDKNADLKDILMAETPWYAESLSDKEQKKNLAEWLNPQQLTIANNKIIKLLTEQQSVRGGFSRFTGSEDNVYVTSRILAGLGHLRKLGVSFDNDQLISEIENKAFGFLEEAFFKRQTKKESQDTYLSPLDLYYLYICSLFPNHTIPAKIKIDEIRQQIAGEFLAYHLYQKAQAMLILHRAGFIKETDKIGKHLKESSVENSSIGTYWNENKPGWNWYENPVETQALLIEAFTTLNSEDKTIEPMKAWLIAQKKTTKWRTTKATAAAVYTLMLEAKNNKENIENIIVEIGANEIKFDKDEEVLGEIRREWKNEYITVDFGKVSMENKSGNTIFGGVYWSYLGTMNTENIPPSEIMQLTKKIFVKKIQGNTEILHELKADDVLVIGDVITVQLQIQLTHPMEYLHLKDAHAACFEPEDLLSGYMDQPVGGYYKSSKDTSTHFFFDALNKGTYTLEYRLRVSHQGNFNNGEAILQSIYAPEFRTQTKQTRILVK